MRWTCRAVARDNVQTRDDHQPGFAYRLGMSMLFFVALSGLGLVTWKFVVHGPWWIFAGVVLFILWWFEGPGNDRRACARGVQLTYEPRPIHSSPPS